MEKEIIKEINRTRNNLSSCVCKQGYKDLIRFVKKLFNERKLWVRWNFAKVQSAINIKLKTG